MSTRKLRGLGFVLMLTASLSLATAPPALAAGRATARSANGHALLDLGHRFIAFLVGLFDDVHTGIDPNGAH
ncbi:MAG TPA: hypothetical protein VHR45_24580 [Thermoanaerobaculia bacterium]|nr:hypothetical protein [Thermoanaerobaculia bacterium]